MLVAVAPFVALAIHGVVIHHVGNSPLALSAQGRAFLGDEILLGGAALLLALLLAWYLAGFLSRPLRRLTSDAAALSRGDFTRRARPGGAREVVELAEAFNRMAGALEQRTTELAEGERRYRELFEEIPLPLLLYDEQSLRILAVNHAAIQHYGWTRDEFLGLTITDIRPAGDVPALRTFLAGSPVPHRHAGVWRHLRKDGTIIDVEITSHAIEFGGHAARIVLANDVTERRRHEAEAQRFAEELEARVTALSGQPHRVWPSSRDKRSSSRSRRCLERLPPAIHSTSAPDTL